MILLAAAAGVSGCTYKTAIPTEFPTPPPSAAATPVREIDLKRDGDLERQFDKISVEAKGRVGAAAVVLETGEAALLNGDGHYPMQSVYKLPISMAILEQVRAGELDLDEKIGVGPEDMVSKGQRSPLRDENPKGGEFTVRELIRLALVESDGTASDVLMRVAGGPAAIQSYLTQIGIREIKVANTEKEFHENWQTQYENWATASGAVKLLNWLRTATKDLGAVEFTGPADVACNCPTSQQNHMRYDDLRLIVGLTEDSIPGDKRIKGLLPKGTVVAHKTGTGGSRNGVTSATNDIGIVSLPNGHHMAIAVFVSDSAAPSDAVREAVIAKIAKAAWDRWAK